MRVARFAPTDKLEARDRLAEHGFGREQQKSAPRAERETFARGAEGERTPLGRTRAEREKARVREGIDEIKAPRDRCTNAFASQKSRAFGDGLGTRRAGGREHVGRAREAEDSCRRAGASTERHGKPSLRVRRMIGRSRRLRYCFGKPGRRRTCDERDVLGLDARRKRSVRERRGELDEFGETRRAVGRRDFSR